MRVVDERSFSFAGFTLDLRRGSLRRDEREIELRAKSFAVLRYFVENAGRLMPRDELMTAIWRDVVVTDESLTHCVSDIRCALGDVDQRIIKTVLGRGYTFLAPVTELGAAAPNGHGSPRLVLPPESGHTDRVPLERRHPERRQLTILFCDLVGSTALSGRLDPEDLHDLMSAYHCACAAEITKAGGFAAEQSGDAVIAYFGYPLAQEDDAERAIRAALGLRDTIGALVRARGSALQSRIGIATGLVVVGDIIGTGDVRVAGEAPVIASRLQGLAAPDRIVIADGTRRLAGDVFEYRDLGAVMLRGRAEPVQAWEVSGTSALRSRFAAKRGARLTPLVSREEEMELLQRRWRQAKSGMGRVMLIAGEPGIGKSRLIVELGERLASEPHTALQYFCSPDLVDSPFHPVVAQLERTAGFDRYDGTAAKLDKLATLLGGAAPDGSDLPLLAELLSIPTGDRFVPRGWSPQRKKRETLEALLRQFERASRHGPVLAVVEDVHWIDPSSLELLDMMVERVADLPVLLVVTYRPEFQPPWVDASHATLLRLSRLSQQDSAALAALVAGDGALPADILAAIAAHSDGIPIFVEELTKTVEEARGCDEARRSAAAVPALTIPATLRASLMARLDRLGPAANEVADIAAVIGREFSHELLEPVAQKGEEDLKSALARLRDAGLVYCRGTPPRATYTFKHALVRDAAYERLLRGPRRSLHARIASTLEKRFPETGAQKPELLALHWTEAGSIGKAIGYWVEAARLARSRHALQEAVALARKGLALLSGREDGPERWRAELQLHSDLGWALFHWKGEEAPEAGAALSRGRALCVLLGDKPRLGPMLYAEASHHIACARFIDGRRMAEQLLCVALECNDVGLEATAHETLGRSYHWCGAYGSAIAHFEHALRDPAAGARDQFRLARDGRAISLAYLAADLACLGYLDRAAALRDQALALARQAHPHTLAIALLFARGVDLDRGKLQAALECRTAFEALTREQSFTFHTATVDLSRAVVSSVRGETEEGLSLARRALADPAMVNRMSGQTLRLLLLAGCCERAGRVDEALSLLDTGLEKAATTGERCNEPELHRLRGAWLAAHRPERRAEAEECHRQAIAVARAQQAKLYELRAATGLARLWRGDGRHGEARDLLAPIYGWFTEGLDAPDLQTARSLLDTL
ncbi:MAG TPA: AAA family ATPase [Stellaceae bacterium]|jgi:class 3 adenylate cyclase/tetratricopeptide (TPR) repeat protein|nr:AAA family ATPase [Stellaceae bacterium]